MGTSIFDILKLVNQLQTAGPFEKMFDNQVAQDFGINLPPGPSVDISMEKQVRQPVMPTNVTPEPPGLANIAASILQRQPQNFPAQSAPQAAPQQSQDPGIASLLPLIAGAGELFNPFSARGGPVSVGSKINDAIRSMVGTQQGLSQIDLMNARARSGGVGGRGRITEKTLDNGLTQRQFLDPTTGKLTNLGEPFDKKKKSAAAHAQDLALKAQESAGDIQQSKLALDKWNIKVRESRGKAQRGISNFARQSRIVNEDVDRALSLIERGGPKLFGVGKPIGVTGISSFLSVLPETDARTFTNLLTGIKANIGFDTLQRMREASPTGGAVGNVSNFEQELLQAVNGVLDEKADAESIIHNLKRIKELQQAADEDMRASFVDIFEQEPVSGATNAAPGDAEMQELLRLRKKYGRR